MHKYSRGQEFRVKHTPWRPVGASSVVAYLQHIALETECMGQGLGRLYGGVGWIVTLWRVLLGGEP